MAYKRYSAVDVFFNLLCYLYNNEEKGVSEADLCKAFDMSLEDLMPVLECLEANNWVSVDPDLNYHIGKKMLYFADLERLNTELIRQIKAPLLRLSETCHQTVEVNVIESTNIICIYKIEPNNAVRISSKIGRQGPLYAGASGKTLLAYASASLQDLVLNTSLTPFTSKTLTDKDELLRELNEIKTRGYAESIEELDPGAACIAVPVLNGKGNILAEVSIIGTKFDYEKHRDFWLAELISTVHDLPIRHCCK